MKLLNCKIRRLITAPMLLLIVSVPIVAFAAGNNDNPVLSRIIIDHLEVHNSDSHSPLVLKGQGWIGQDLNKFWFKVETESEAGDIEEAEVQALYSRALTPYWDIQMGMRWDIEPSPTRGWAMIGLQGLAPYFFQVETALFVGESGDTAIRFEAEYELLFTQRLILSPQIEMNLYGQNNMDLGVGSGLSDLHAGLRLRYEIDRQLAPYIGMTWAKRFGNSAEFAHSAGEKTDELQLLLGISAWF